MLLGPAATGIGERLYIGEADELRSRIDSQAKGKDFWTEAVSFTSKDANLNKAHVRYLEARLIGLAGHAKRSELENGTAPPLPHLSEADQADVEAYLEQVLVILPVLGVVAFEIPTEPATGVQGEKQSSHAAMPAETGSEQLFLHGKGGVDAVGADRPEGFVVFAGATARLTAVPSIHSFLEQKRQSLLSQGLLVNDGERLRLTQHYVFDSPSTAAGVLLARSANGRIEWKDGKGRTLKEIQQAALEGQQFAAL